MSSSKENPRQIRYNKRPKHAVVEKQKKLSWIPKFGKGCAPKTPFRLLMHQSHPSSKGKTSESPVRRENKKYIGQTVDAVLLA